MTRDGNTQDAPASGTAPSEQERRVVSLLDRRAEFADEQAFLTALRALLCQQRALEDVALARVVSELETPDGLPAAWFWEALAARFPEHAYVVACHGNALLAEGRDAEALERIDLALRLDPLVVDELDEATRDVAESQGGPVWLRYQLAEFQARLASITAARTARRDVRGQAAELDGDDDDDAADSVDDELDLDDDDEELGEVIREDYSELLDEYHDDPAALQEIRQLGRTITELENQGILPRCLIRRGSTRR